MNRRELAAEVQRLTDINADLTGRLTLAAEALLEAQRARDNANEAARLTQVALDESRERNAHLVATVDAAHTEVASLRRQLTASETALRAERKVHLELECSQAEIDALFEHRTKDET